MSLPSSRNPYGAARDRRARILALLEANPERQWTAREVHERLWRYAPLKAIATAIAVLCREGLIRCVVPSRGGHSSNVYAAAERKAS